MDNHISDIYIRSFRGINNLELKDIKLINILTGDNNGGKTSVLEIIQSIKNPCNFRTWRSLIRRGERISVIRGMSYYEGLLVIPFEDTGAMETFLLNAIANDSAYDAEIIRKGNQFVEEVDKERKYLTKRRYITKSKFDVYFSIRTAAEQFVERQNILKRVPWEQYSQIQEEFQKLNDLT